MNNDATETPPEAGTYLPRDDEYRVRKDPAESTATAVVFLVASATNRDVLDLPPLSDAIEVDALNELFQGGERRAEPAEVSLEFEYASCTVTVTSDQQPLVRCRVNR